MTEYVFTNDWFGWLKPVWRQLLEHDKPKKVLEVGSYEGASACYLIDTLTGDSPIEVHCVDSWQGGVEHQAGGANESDMTAVEARFKANIALSLSRAPGKVEMFVHRCTSDLALSRLLAAGKAGYFDLVYIDGSHLAADVLCDAVLGFKLLRVGGMLIFDDYLWSEDRPEGKNPLRCPKPAIDAFVNLNSAKLSVIRAPLSQLYVRKTSA